jgi:hypothetical protein
MSGGAGPETYWLNVTNVVLGVATLLPVLGVLALTLAELWGRRKARHGH